MIGISNNNGRLITDLDHVKQSITDILTTPIGSRVKLCDYGSDIYKYRDNPINTTTIANIYKAVAEAIDKWEPRISLVGGKLTVKADQNGKLVINVEFKYKGETVSLGETTI